jgi:general secretion pathway protein G
MERNIRTGKDDGRHTQGFTLIELMIVVSIIGILATIAVPSYQSSLIKAKETVLRQDLFTLRELLDQHRADQGKYPWGD